MQEFLVKNGTELVVFVFVLLSIVALLTPLALYIIQWRRVRQADIEASLYRAELEASLKKDMLNRGMSAPEIAQVLQASSGEASTPPGFAALFAQFLDQAGKAGGEAGEKGWEALAQNWKEFGKGWKKFGKMWGKGCGWRHHCNT